MLPGALRAVDDQCVRPCGATQRGDRVDQQNARAEDRHDREQGLIRGDHRANPCRSDGDQERVTESADHHHHSDMFTAQALTKHEGVLGTDRDDQTEEEAESGQGSGQHGDDTRQHTTNRPANVFNSSLAKLKISRWSGTCLSYAR